MLFFSKLFLRVRGLANILGLANQGGFPGYFHHSELVWFVCCEVPGNIYSFFFILQVSYCATFGVSS